MHLFFISQSKDRYKQFDFLCPYVSDYAYVTPTIKKNFSPHYIEPLFYLERISKLEDVILVFDYESVEIEALNGFPNHEFSIMHKVGLKNIESLLKNKKRKVTHKTFLQTVFYVEEGPFRITFSGEKDGTVIKKLSSREINQPEDIFMIENYDIAVSALPVCDKAVSGSLGMATKKLLEFIENSSLKGILEKKNPF